jgi:hypothetical protein
MSIDIVASSLVGILAAVIGAVVIVLGWRVAHRQEMERARANEKRRQRIEYLIQAYRRLEAASNRSDPKNDLSGLESAIADVQLFGSARQVELAQQFATHFAGEGAASLDTLLQELRRDLRSELDLEPVPAPLKFLRIK